MVLVLVEGWNVFSSSKWTKKLHGRKLLYIWMRLLCFLIMEKSRNHSLGQKSTSVELYFTTPDIFSVLAKWFSLFQVSITHQDNINIKHFLSPGCTVQFSIQRAAFSIHSWRCRLLPSLADQWIPIVSSVTNFTQDKCNFYQQHSNVNVRLKLVKLSICYLFYCVQIFFRQLQIIFSQHKN